MARKYVCNPKTGRAIEVDGATYKKIRKNAAVKRTLARSPKSSTKKKLIPCKSPRRRTKSPKRKKNRRYNGHLEPEGADLGTCYHSENCLADPGQGGAPTTDRSNIAYSSCRYAYPAGYRSWRSNNPKGGCTRVNLGGATSRMYKQTTNLKKNRRYNGHLEPEGADLGTCYHSENCLADPGQGGAPTTDRSNIAYSSCRYAYPAGYRSWRSNNPKGGCTRVNLGGATPRNYKQNTNLDEKEWGELEAAGYGEEFREEVASWPPNSDAQKQIADFYRKKLLVLAGGMSWSGPPEDPQWWLQETRQQSKEEREKDLDEVRRLLTFPDSVKVNVNTASPTRHNLRRDVESWTPLMHAARSGNADMIHLLLDHGADPNLYSDSGYTAQEIAQNFGHTDNYLFPEKRIRDGFDLLNSHGGLYTPRDLSELVAEFGSM